jgi:hypothetical protein
MPDRSEAVATHLAMACLYIREQWADPKVRVKKIRQLAEKMAERINDEEMWRASAGKQ